MYPRILLTLLLASCISEPAFAVDPECVGLTGAQPVYAGCELKMNGVSATLRFCAPQLDVDGDLLLAGSISSCTITLDDVLVSTVPIAEPGQLFTAILTGKNLGHKIGAFCTNAEGVQGEVWVSDLCFPSGTTRPPHLIQE